MDGMYREVPSPKRDKNDNFVATRTRRYKRIKTRKFSKNIIIIIIITNPSVNLSERYARDIEK